MDSVNIDKEFSLLIPPLSAEELNQLEANILQDGCRDPLVLWNGTLLDGHNRYRICQKHGLSFNIHEIELADRDAAIDWIDKNQLGRRNLTPEQMSLLRGRRYNRMKKAQGGDHKSKDQNDTLINSAETLSQQHGVSSATIKRDGQFASDVELLKTIVPDIEQKIIANEEKLTKQEIKIAADLAETHPEAAAAIITKQNHRAIGTGENEWYTPIEYISAVADLFDGTIDLDPASSDLAQEKIGAKTYFTIEDDGLKKPWSGKVFLNPPYSQPAIAQFTEKLASEWDSGNIEAAVVLTHNYTDTAWWHRLANACTAVCFTRGRIAFVNPEGKKASPTQGQCFFYYGPEPKAFEEIFSAYGFVFWQ